MLHDSDTKVQSYEYLNFQKGKHRETISGTRHNSRATIMAGITPMDGADGGKRRFFEYILQDMKVSIPKAYLTSEMNDLDESVKRRRKNYEDNMRILTSILFVYFQMNHSLVADGREVPWATDKFAFITIDLAVEMYKKQFNIIVNNDAIRRCRMTAKIMCLVRAVYSLFFYEDTKYKDVKTIDHMEMYKLIQKRAYVNYQDVILALNICNVEFMDQTDSSFMQSIWKEYLPEFGSGKELENKKEILEFHLKTENDPDIHFLVKSKKGQDLNKMLDVNYISIEPRMTKWKFIDYISKKANLSSDIVFQIINRKSSSKVLWVQYEAIEYTANVNNWTTKRKIKETELKLKRGADGNAIKCTQSSIIEFDAKTNDYRICFHVSTLKSAKMRNENNTEDFLKIVRTIMTYNELKSEHICVINFSSNFPEIIPIYRMYKEFRESFEDIENVKRVNRDVLQQKRMSQSEWNKFIKKRQNWVLNGMVQRVDNESFISNMRTGIRTEEEPVYVIEKDIGTMNRELHYKEIECE